MATPKSFSLICLTLFLLTLTCWSQSAESDEPQLTVPSPTITPKIFVEHCIAGLPEYILVYQIYTPGNITVNNGTKVQVEKNMVRKYVPDSTKWDNHTSSGSLDAQVGIINDMRYRNVVVRVYSTTDPITVSVRGHENETYRHKTTFPLQDAFCTPSSDDDGELSSNDSIVTSKLFVRHNTTGLPEYILVYQICATGNFTVRVSMEDTDTQSITPGDRSEGESTLYEGIHAGLLVNKDESKNIWCKYAVVLVSPRNYSQPVNISLRYNRELYGQYTLPLQESVTTTTTDSTNPTNSTGDIFGGNAAVSTLVALLLAVSFSCV